MFEGCTIKKQKDPHTGNVGVINVTYPKNSDGMVNIYDLTNLLGDFGCIENCSADLDFNGSVGTGDIAVFLSVFGSFCE